MKPRLLVTGGAGFLGTHLLRRARYFTATGTRHSTTATAIPDVSFHVCDLQQAQEVRILLDRVRPGIIIHTACSDQGGNLSAIAPTAGLLAIQSAERRIRFIHLSTDQVFDGSEAPYNKDENMVTVPKQVLQGLIWNSELAVAGLGKMEEVVGHQCRELQRYIDAGAKPCGLGARDTLRLEVCYPLNGSDLSPTRTPRSAGLGFAVSLTKECGFIGWDVVMQEKEDGFKERLMALAYTGKGAPPRAHYEVYTKGGSC